MKSTAWTASAETGAQLRHAGKLPAAARAYETVITLAERAGDARGLADARRGLEWVYLAQNKPHDGYRCFPIASTTPGLSPDSAELCAAVIGLGDAEHARMAFAAAIPHYERAIGVLVANNSYAALAGVHASLALCLAMLNRLDDADRNPTSPRASRVSPRRRSWRPRPRLCWRSFGGCGPSRKRSRPALVGLDGA